MPARRQQPRFIRCAIYTRQSVARPGANPTLASCRLQRDACFRFIAAHLAQGWLPIAEDFDDEGESGGSIERPAFQRVLERIDEGLIDQVVVHRLDRLTRSVRDWGRIQTSFDQHSVKLAVVAGALETGTTAAAGFQLNMLASLAEFERSMISDRLRDARAARRQRGLRSAGRIPFGYASEPHTRQLLVVPAEAPIVKLAFNLAAKGLNPAQIAQSLNKGPHAKPDAPRNWIPRTVLRMLRNRTYLGLMPDGSTSIHDEIVTQALFNRVAASLDQRRTRTATPRPRVDGVDPFLLRGLLVCAQCGARMTTTSRAKIKPLPPTGHGRVPSDRYYRCRGANPCRGSHVSAEYVENGLIELMATPPRGLPQIERNVYMCIAWMWPNLVHENRKRFLDAYLDSVVWHPTWAFPRPVLADDLRRAIVAQREREAGPASPEP